MYSAPSAPTARDPRTGYTLAIPDQERHNLPAGVRLSEQWFTGVFKPPKLTAADAQIVDLAAGWLSKIPGLAADRAGLADLMSGAEERRVQFLALDEGGAVGVKKKTFSTSEKAYSNERLEEGKQKGLTTLTLKGDAQNAQKTAQQGFELALKRGEISSNTPYLDAVEVLTQASRRIAAMASLPEREWPAGLTREGLMRFALNAAALELRAEQSFQRGKNQAGVTELIEQPTLFPNPTFQHRAEIIQPFLRSSSDSETSRNVAATAAHALALCLLGPKDSYGSAVKDTLDPRGSAFSSSSSGSGSSSSLRDSLQGLRPDSAEWAGILEAAQTAKLQPLFEGVLRLELTNGETEAALLTEQNGKIIYRRVEKQPNGIWLILAGGPAAGATFRDASGGRWKVENNPDGSHKIVQL